MEIDFQNDIKIHRLQSDMFDIADFRCSNPDYEKHLKHEAFKEQGASISQTWVFVLKEKNIVGYVSLAMGNVVKTRHEKLRPLPHADAPGVLLGQLATHLDYEKHGIGRYMLLWVFLEAIKQSNHIGCRIVYLNPEDNTVGWYTRIGFAHIKLKHKQDIMFYDINRYKKEINAWAEASSAHTRG